MAKTICLDFDGVLHSYASGWTGKEPKDPPCEGAQEFVRWLLDAGFKVCVSSCRANSDEGRREMRRWLTKWGFPELPLTHEKPAAWLYVDDRGFRFEGNFEDVKHFIRRELKEV